MTRVNITCAGGLWRITAEGHADGAPEACSGVSALLWALAGWLRGAPADVSARSAAVLAPGHAALVFPGGAEADAAATLVAVGLAQIAKRYPQAVAVEARRSGEPRGERIAASLRSSQ